MKLKKPVKIILGIVIFLTLPTLLLFGFLHYKYAQPIPYGIEGKEADKLATKMLIALNYEGFKNTDYIEWTFKSRRHFKWKKSDNICEVYFESYKVKLDLLDDTKSEVYANGFILKSELANKIHEKGKAYYKKDLFWLIAPFQVFDAGVTRKLVTTDGNKKALLVTYNNTDSYLWHFDDKLTPISCNIWNDLTPIDGLEASWKDWKTTKTGVKLPTSHNVLVFDFSNMDIKVE